jgi:hypothetical protein
LTLLLAVRVSWAAKNIVCVFKFFPANKKKKKKKDPWLSLLMGDICGKMYKVLSRVNHKDAAAMQNKTPDAGSLAEKVFIFDSKYFSAKQKRTNETAWKRCESN